MLDLDKYINNSIELKVHGETVHVKQPTVAMIEKLDTIQKSSNKDNMTEKRIEAAILFINNNEENKVFTEKDLKEWTLEAIAKVIAELSVLRYEAENDPN